jgi:hypothetical protein
LSRRSKLWSSFDIFGHSDGFPLFLLLDGHESHIDYHFLKHISESALVSHMGPVNGRPGTVMDKRVFQNGSNKQTNPVEQEIGTLRGIHHQQIGRI